MENNDFIEIYENPTLQKVCNGLVEWFDICSANNFTKHNMPFNSGEKPAIKLRSDEAMSIPAGSLTNNYPVGSGSVPGDICDAFWNILNECYYEYITKYSLEDAFANRPLSCYTFKIHKVKTGQGYHVWHHETESTSSLHRVLAWMTYLKVPEEGGETEFLYQSKRIEPVVGRTLIWPAYFTHLHRGNPPLKGEKYYVTGWFERD